MGNNIFNTGAPTAASLTGMEQQHLQRRHELVELPNDLDTRSDEQDAFGQGPKHVLGTSFQSTEASMDLVFELVPPEALVARSCLHVPKLYIVMRDTLFLCGYDD